MCSTSLISLDRKYTYIISNLFYLCRYTATRHHYDHYHLVFGFATKSSFVKNFKKKWLPTDYCRLLPTTADRCDCRRPVAASIAYPSAFTRDHSTRANVFAKLEHVFRRSNENVRKNTVPLSSERRR